MATLPSLALLSLILLPALAAFAADSSQANAGPTEVSASHQYLPADGFAAGLAEIHESLRRALAGSQSTVYNVLQHGAKNGINFDSTAGFQSAMDAACKQSQGSPVILVPSNAQIRVLPMAFGGCQNKKLTIEIAGKVVGPANPSQWGSATALFSFHNFVGLAITGPGSIDGYGGPFWSLSKNIRCSSVHPALVEFYNSQYCTVQGLHTYNSPYANFLIRFSAHITLSNVQIFAPSTSKNTDGIAIKSSNNVAVYNSYIQNSDDCVTVKPGSHDILIKGVTCAFPSHGISIGSLGQAGSKDCVSRVTAQDIILKGTTNGLRIKTYQGGQGMVSDVAFSNVQLQNVEHPLNINQYYCDKSCSTCPGIQAGAVAVRNVSFTNVKGTVADNGAELLCSASVPCVGISLNNVYLLSSKGSKPAKHKCIGAHGSESQTNQVSCLVPGKPVQPLKDYGGC